MKSFNDLTKNTWKPYCEFCTKKFPIINSQLIPWLENTNAGPISSKEMHQLITKLMYKPK